MNVWVTQALGHNTLNQVLMCLDCAAKFEFLIFDTDYAAVDGNTTSVAAVVGCTSHCLHCQCLLCRS